MKKHLLRLMLLAIAMTMGASTVVRADAQKNVYVTQDYEKAKASDLQPTVALKVPVLESYNGKVAYSVNFSTTQTIDGNEVETTVYYKIDDGSYELYTGNSVEVPYGATLSYYAKAQGYIDSPVATITATAPIWQTKEEVWWDGFRGETDTPVTLRDDMPINGYYYMMRDGDLLSEHLLTPNENLGDGFRITSNGLYSDVDRDYAIADLTEGQYVGVWLRTGDGEIKVEEPEVPIKDRLRKAAQNRRRVIDAGTTLAVKNLQGLEIDEWISEDREGQSWKCYYMRVTESGNVMFTVAGGLYIENVSAIDERVADAPYFDSQTIDGANRTFRIFNTGATLQPPRWPTSLLPRTAMPGAAPPTIM